MDGILQIALLGGLFFLMMKFGCGSHSSGHGAHGNSKDAKKSKGGCCGGKKKSVIPAEEEEQTQEALPNNDVDPVCNQTVSTDQAKTSLYNGLVYFFCSNECRDEFENKPEQYAVPGPDSEM